MMTEAHPLASSKSPVVAYRINFGTIKWSRVMMKLLIGTTLILTALPFTFDGITPAVSKAHAIVGRPLTPLSVAGMHRRCCAADRVGWRYAGAGDGFTWRCRC